MLGAVTAALTAACLLDAGAAVAASQRAIRAEPEPQSAPPAVVDENGRHLGEAGLLGLDDVVAAG